MKKNKRAGIRCLFDYHEWKYYEIVVMPSDSITMQHKIVFKKYCIHCKTKKEVEIFDRKSLITLLKSLPKKSRKILEGEGIMHAF